MNCFEGLNEYHDSSPSAVTVGKFDGVHIGHQKLLDVIRENKTADMKVIFVTFEFHPEGILTLYTARERRCLLEKTGVDCLIEFDFNDDFMKTSPEDFIKLLYERLNMRLLVCGSDFRFGYKGRGDKELLSDLKDEFGFDLIVIDKCRLNDRDISSTLIREKIDSGDINAANKMLGHPYFIMGEIAHGSHLGHTIGFPTINLNPPDDKLLPTDGVYISTVHIDGRKYHGITDIGKKPTVCSDIKKRIVETHLLDFSGEIYGKTARVELLEFLRKEERFSNISLLKRQISEDKKRAVEYFRQL